MLPKTLIFFAYLGVALSCFCRSYTRDIDSSDMAQLPDDESEMQCNCCGIKESEQPYREAASLHQAAYFGDAGQLQQFIQQGADVSSADGGYENQTPLQLAVESGSKATVKALIDAGANVSAQNGNGLAPLHTATANGYLHIVQLLMDAGADINARTNKGRTPLHAAARSWQPKIATLLLDAGADANARDGEGRSPLHEAALSESQGMLELLLAAGADINAVDDAGRTPLQLAIDDVRMTVDFLLEHGATVTVTDTRDPEGNTILHRASQISTALLKAVLAAAGDGGADLEAVNEAGETPLLYAAAYGDVAALRVLLEAGADVQARSRDGETALHMASGDPAASYLGERPDAVDKVKLLLEAGVDMDARTTGLTAIERAGRSRNPKVAELLRERGAAE